MSRMLTIARLRPILSASAPQRKPQTRLARPRIMNMLPACLLSVAARRR